ncbi:type II TA system antitoxin MqsA family protein [Chitinophaga filiformis]|uniref:Putative zinc finger/helix-turn-helix protein, YgiT family n=1 Tax=Chitinophaga filiformis TaxID=104663 RepID=A0A1G7GKS3_CHIFI|nr:type II TA system antitoxin MqsA family protein [Chitinophaga filiformis]SDE88736.1 putative zinc finger/helix-turn-helix protein, YgiT family [Chitinophaga filiformis]
MKSPYTGKEMVRRLRAETIDFRKESFSILYHFYWDEESGEELTDEELENLNLNQVYNQYREKYNLPFPDQIKEIRDKYSLTQTKMAEVLGFGVNMYRQYENGEIPNISNARLIQLAEDPAEFRKLVNTSINVLDDKALKEVNTRIDTLLIEQNDFHFNGLPQYLMSGGHTDKVTVYTGYRRPSLRRLTEMIVFFASELKPWKTQLNKLLFYADFYHYKKTAYSISGAEYYAIPMGPVPNNFNSIFEYVAQKEDVTICYHEFQEGRYGEEFLPREGRNFEARLFSKEELETLKAVKSALGRKQTKEIIDISHDELAWKENIGTKAKISYKYAFDLKYM